jgi:hypothetical protein
MNGKAHLSLVPFTSDPHHLEPAPVLVISRRSTNYNCGKCGTPLQRDEAVATLKLWIRCTVCEAFNSTMVSNR